MAVIEVSITSRDIIGAGEQHVSGQTASLPCVMTLRRSDSESPSAELLLVSSGDSIKIPTINGKPQAIGQSEENQEVKTTAQHYTQQVNASGIDSPPHVQVCESNNILSAQKKEPAIGSQPKQMAAITNELDEARDTSDCKAEGVLANRYKLLTGDVTMDHQLVLHSSSRIENEQAVTGQQVSATITSEEVKQNGHIGQEYLGLDEVQTPTKKIDQEMQQLVSERRQFSRSQQKASRRHDRHEYVYNHNNVLLGEKIEDVDFHESYFTRPSRVNKKAGHTGDQSSRKKRQTGAANIGNGIHGYLPDCKHRFCYDCITQWAKICTRCPLCKVPFNVVFKIKNGERIDCQRFKKKGLDDESDEENPEEIVVIPGTDENCYVCNNAENSERLMVCDHCNYKVCHNYCLETQIDWIPEEDFYCAECCTRFNLKNEFAPPQQFNAELYEQIVNQGEPQQQEPERQRRRGLRNTRRRRMSSEDDDYGTFRFQYRRRRFAFRDEPHDGGLHSENLLAEGFNNQERTNEVTSRLNTRRTDSESFSDDGEVLPSHTARMSRSDRLKLRQAAKENARAPPGIKYKPSPVKKVHKDLRGHWRRLRQMTEGTGGQEAWRLFDHKDINTHQNVSKLMQMVRSTELAAIDPMEYYLKLHEDFHRPRFYDRKLKMAVDEPPKPSYIEEEEEGEEEGDYEEEQSQNDQYDDDERSHVLEESERSSEISDQEKGQEESFQLEESQEAQPKPYKMLVTRGRRSISKLYQEDESTIKETVHKSIIAKKAKQKIAIQKRKQLNKIVAAKIRQTIVDKRTESATKELIPAVMTFEDKPMSKRQPRKVVDFDFDKSGNKVIITENISQINKKISENMGQPKVAAKAQNRKIEKPKSRSVSKQEKSKSRIILSKEKSKKLSVQNDRKASTKKGVQTKIKEPKKDAAPKKRLGSAKRVNRGSESPIKGGLSNLFDVHYLALAPLTKRDAKEHHDEYLAIRKLAEMEDAKEKRGKFRFAFKKGEKSAPKVPRERSREVEKYVKGQPIKHSCLALNNLSLLTYKD